jgi:hypothetical protein
MAIRKTKVTKLMPVETEIEQPEAASPEETELSDFLDGLGPQGVTEVKLYRVLTSGKQKFITSGPPAQFSEQYVQITFGEGDYMVRSRLNGVWYRSKNFSVEAAPGAIALGVNGGRESELERLRMDLEAQRLRLAEQQAEVENNRREQQAQIETDRRERELRNHELQLKMFESFGNRGSSNDTASMTSMISGMIGGIKSLKDLSGNVEPLAQFNQYLEMFERMNALKSNGDGNWWQPLVAEGARTVGEVARSIAPALPSIFMAGKPNGVTVTAAPTIPPAGQPGMVPPVGAGAAGLPPVSSPTAQNSSIAPVVQPAAGQPAAETPQGGASIPQPENPASAAVPTVDQFQAYKKGVIDFVMPFAVSGGNPELYAELAVHQISTGDVGIARLFQELIESKDFDSWFDDWRKVDPGILSHRVWFSGFYEAAKAIIAASQEADRGDEKP